MQHLNTLLYFEMYIGNNKKVIKTDEVSAKSLKAEKSQMLLQVQREEYYRIIKSKGFLFIIFSIVKSLVAE